MRWTDLTIAATAAAGGMLAIAGSIRVGEAGPGLLLGVLLLVDALACVRLARRR